MARTTQRRKRGSDEEPQGSVEEQAEQVAPEEESDDQEESGNGGGMFSELKGVTTAAALAVLAPVAKQAATSAAKYAVKKGPELVQDKVMPAIEDAGGPKELVGQLVSPDGPAGGLVSKLTGGDEGGGLMSKLTGGDDDDGGDGDAGDGTGRGRRMPVQQAVDVAAPIDVVYDQWTQFEDYPRFTHRVQRVEQRDDSHVAFHTKVWGINRMWEAEIVEQRPDERIVFKSVNGVQLTGVVTFHDLAERLTRIEVNIDIDPDGPIEKIARGARFVKRATRGDLKRFKAFVEMHEDETGAWRGEIQDGDVVSESDEERGDEDYEDEDYEEQPEAEYDEDEEPEAGEVDEPEAEYDDEQEEEESQPARSRSRGSSSRSSASTRKRGASSKQSSKKSSSSRSRGSKNGKGASSKSRSSSQSRSRGSSNGSSKSKSGGGRSQSRSRGSSNGSSKSKSGGGRSSSRSRS